MTARQTFYTLLLLAPLCSSAQKKGEAPASPYPTDYFRNPLDIPIFLAGNFGECRPGHFHSGIDIKTKGEEGQPVHAAADGYISRIKMEKGGFGHGIYITHPNGYTTLYAHLSTFSTAIQQYVKDKQYEKQRWDVDLQLSPSQFPVKKGDQIALSGNTGASTAPHLHFEIRNTKTEHPLNPELFGMPITDEIAPVVKELALYTGNVYSGAPVFVPLRKTGNVYKPQKPTNDKAQLDKDTIAIATNKPLGIGVNADDFMEGSDNSLTFYTAKLYMDDNIQAQVTLDDIGYDESRYINAYADYRTRTQYKKWMQCLFQLPGNKLNIFSQLNSNKGRLDISDNKAHKIEIVLTDDKNNEARISCYVRGTSANAAEETASGVSFIAGRVNTYKDNNINFTLDERQLYDDINLAIAQKPAPGMYSDKISLHYAYVPLHHFFDLMIRPIKAIPFALRSKVVLMYSDGSDEEGSAAKLDDNGWYKTSVRNFGTYWLSLDTVAPVIKCAQKNGANLAAASQILLTVTDAATSVRTFNGYIDDKWICFEQHGSSFFYKFDEHCSKGKHTLVFKAADENGNQNTFRFTFTR